MQRGRILLACSFLLIAACTGSENSDLFDPAVTDQKPADPAAGTAAPAPAPGGTASGGGTATASGSTTGSDPAAASGAPKTDPSSTPPVATCLKEIEPNGSLETATSFTSCIDGELSGRDSDFADVIAPKTAKEIVIKHEETGGRVLYRMYMNGMSLPIYTEDLPSTMMVKPGATYTFEAISGGSESATWKLEIAFQ